MCGWLSLTSSWTSSQGGGEVASYAPWVTATNAALSLLRSITVPGTRPMRTGDDEILMQQNDPNMKHQRNSQTTLRKPDNLFLKAAVAKRLWESDSWEEVANNNAFRKLPSRDQWKKQLKDISWNDKLQWIDTLCSCEHIVRYVPDQEDQEDVLEANESETPGWSFRIASTLHPHGQVAGTNPTTSPHKDLGLSLYLISRYLSHVAQGNRTPPPPPNKSEISQTASTSNLLPTLPRSTISAEGATTSRAERSSLCYHPTLRYFSYVSQGAANLHSSLSRSSPKSHPPPTLSAYQVLKKPQDRSPSTQVCASSYFPIFLLCFVGARRTNPSSKSSQSAVSQSESIRGPAGSRKSANNRHGGTPLLKRPSLCVHLTSRYLS